MNAVRCFKALALCVVCIALSATLVAVNGAGQGNPTPAASAGGLSAAMRGDLTKSLERGAAYLRQTQKPDGTWENHPGITGMAATALLKQPGARAHAMTTVAKTLSY